MNNVARWPWREAVAEFIATAFLLIAIVGSGIAADRLCGGNAGLALLVNAIATGAALFALIVVFAQISGAHMNPLVTVMTVILGGLERKTAAFYIIAQVAGAIMGVWLTHLMFDVPVFQLSAHVRTGAGQWTAEIVATLGLLIVVWGCAAHQTSVAAGAVAAYITGAYWFAASTSFANPAVTIARALTDTFAGIRPADAPAFILAQCGGLVLALLLLRALFIRTDNAR